MHLGNIFVLASARRASASTAASAVIIRHPILSLTAPTRAGRSVAAAQLLRLAAARKWSPVVEDHHDLVRVRTYQPPDSIDRAVRTVAMQSLVILCRDPVEGANDGRVGATNAEAKSQHAPGRGRIVPPAPCKVLKW